MRKRLALASGLLWALLSTPSARAHDDHGIELFLSNTGVDLDARGRARLDEDDGRQRFEVEVEGLTAGGYAVFVAGAPVGAFDVDSDGEGRLRLEGEPLPFDPRGKTIEVKSDPAGVVFFRGDFPTSRERARRKFKVREDFVNTGVDADAEGRAKLRVKRSKIRFQVKAKDLPQGATSGVGPELTVTIPVRTATADVVGFDWKHAVLYHCKNRCGALAFGSHRKFGLATVSGGAMIPKPAGSQPEVEGENGNPVCRVTIPDISQPPNACPTKSRRLANSGIS